MMQHKQAVSPVAARTGAGRDRAKAEGVRFGRPLRRSAEERSCVPCHVRGDEPD
jgi:hypothetical protein